MYSRPVNSERELGLHVDQLIALFKVMKKFQSNSPPPPPSNVAIANVAIAITL